jgi:hypothetical protein
LRCYCGGGVVDGVLLLDESGGVVVLVLEPSQFEP